MKSFMDQHITYRHRRRIHKVADLLRAKTNRHVTSRRARLKLTTFDVPCRAWAVVTLLCSTSFTVVGVLLEAAVFLRGVDRARRFAKAEQRFERRLSAKGATRLILGDSTAVDVGATRPEESSPASWLPTIPTTTSST